MRAVLLHGTGLALAAVMTAASANAQTASQNSTTATAPAPTPTTPDDGAGQSPSGSADVIVTARKRDEKLIDVPISMQAFSHDEIKAAGITNLEVLGPRAGFQFPPQVSNGPGGRFTGVLIFRGLQANSFGQQRDNSGSLFVDGVYVSGGVQSVNTADVERIEVLKGPQNAYFGRSTFGGAVNFITRNPSDHLGGEVNVRATARGNVDADGSIEGPIVPDLITARVTAYTHVQASQYRANDGGELGAEQSRGVTGTVYITPSSNSFIRLRGSYQRDDDSAPAYGFIEAKTYGQASCIGSPVRGFNGATGVGGLTLARAYFCGGYPTLDQIGDGVITSNTALPANYRDVIRATQTGAAGTLNVPFFSNVPELNHFGLKRDTIFLSAQGRYAFDSGVALAFNVGYNDQRSIDINDVDHSNTLLGFMDAVAFRTKDLTLDGRITSDPSKRIRALLGVSYFSGLTQFSDISYNSFAPNPSRGSNFQNDLAHTPAVYGSVDFDILHNLTLTAEGRYQWDQIISRNAAGIVTSQTFRDFLPRAILKWAPVENSNLYFSYSKGTQPAGVNTGYASLSALANPAQAMAYVQSAYPGIGIFSLVPKLDAFEVGAKQKLFGGAIDYTIALYQNNWHNATTTSSLFNPSSCGATVNTAACPLTAGGISLVTPNEARIRGVEFAITGRATRALTLDLTLDYKNAKWIRYANSGFNQFVGLPTVGAVYRGDGNTIGRVPAISGTYSMTYRGRFNDTWSWYARGDVLFTGSAWDSDLDIFKTNAYARVNTNIGLTRDNITVEFFTTNLFNDRNYDALANSVSLNQGFDFTQRVLAVVPPPRREFGLRGQFKF